jgi:hypothetical protein
MCYGQVDAKTLEREAMDRLRAAQHATRTEAPAEDGVPPELMGGVAGVLARLRAAILPRRTRGA